MTRRAQLVVGVDFGTLSGRALVVSAEDGTELGSAAHAYTHGVIETAMPDGTKLPPAWALQHPQDWLDVLRTAVPAALRAADADPADVVGIGTDFTASTPLPVRADGTPLRALPELAGRPPRGRSSGSTMRHRSRLTASRASRRSAASSGCRATAARSRRSGNSRRRCRCSKRIRSPTQPRSGGSRRPTGSSGSSAASRRATPVRPATRASPGRPLPERGLPRGAERGVRRLRGDKLEHPLLPLGGRAGGLTAEAAVWTGCRRDRRRGRQRRRTRDRAGGARRRARAHARRHGHLDVPRHERRRARDVPGHVRCRRRRHRPWPVRLRGGAERRRRHPRLVRRAPGAAELPRRGAPAGINIHRLLSELAGRRRSGQHGLVALDWHSGNRSVLVDHELCGVLVGADARDPRRAR